MTAPPWWRWTTSSPGAEQNLRSLRGRPGFEFLKQDIIEGLSVEGPVDYVFNLASPASPIDYAQLPLETLRVGSIGTENALKLAEAKKAPCSSRPPPPRCTAIRSCTRSTRATTAT